MFSDRPANAKRQYIEFVEGEDSDRVTEFFGRKSLAAIFGSQDFIKWVKAKYYQLKKDDEIPQSRQLAPTVVEIKEAVSRKYKVTTSSLEEGNRGQVNEPRNVAIYLARKHSGLPLKEIGKEFGFDKYSSVSSVVSRTMKHLAQSKQMRRKVDGIMQQLRKSQAKT